MNRYPKTVVSGLQPGRVLIFAGTASLTMRFVAAVSGEMALSLSAIPMSNSMTASWTCGCRLQGQVLTFDRAGDFFQDQETGSTWNLLGTAVAGPWQGQQLEPLPAHEFFWFAWVAFRPDTLLYEGR